ncbi:MULTISPECIES: DUF1810 domain-containing protein [unclassified Massilia]|uniref:DUF1810 domain-containing protein n=1 Tax=unclassified Massilia TaxID=2609279 RepID=UPI001B81CFF1|nr:MULTISPECIES: DUF1810 domain-containing protein [unclassified Massilia]MBQ5939027.1 DUF1810 domain-containing protein [Massilia sp. AB1]MBQ5962422.1 DUF1810 domain-containing protein [Massilia sp. ZL223]
MSDEFDLQRFVDAQAPVYDTVVAELRAGRKRSHWMWFIFPQIAGLGQSEMSQRYAIRSADEAAAYLAHSLLGHRMNECAGIVAALDADAIEDVFPPPDDVKFHSSMTLFADVAPDVAVFQACIDKYFDGAPDRNTLARL